MSGISFPFDADAVAAADDRFYAAYPEMLSEDGVRIPLSADAPDEESMRRDWIKMYKEELEKKNSGDDPPDPDPVDPIDPVTPCPGNDDCDDCTPIVSIPLYSLSFLNDHGLLKSEAQAWTDTGSRFDPPDWTAAGVSSPVSVTLDKRVEVSIAYTVTAPDACPENGMISATAFGSPAYGYDPAQFAPSAAPATHTPIAVYTAPRLIQRMDTFDIEWTADADKEHRMGVSANELFVTLGPSKEGKHPEDGATLKRMRTSVEWASKTIPGMADRLADRARAFSGAK